MQWKAETRAVIFEHRKKKKKQISKGTTNYRDSDHYHCYKEDPINLNIVSLRAIINDHFSRLIRVTDASGLYV